VKEAHTYMEYLSRWTRNGMDDDDDDDTVCDAMMMKLMLLMMTMMCSDVVMTCEPRKRQVVSRSSVCVSCALARLDWSRLQHILWGDKQRIWKSYIQNAMTALCKELKTYQAREEKKRRRRLRSRQFFTL